MGDEKAQWEPPEGTVFGEPVISSGSPREVVGQLDGDGHAASPSICVGARAQELSKPPPTKSSGVDGCFKVPPFLTAEASRQSAPDWTQGNYWLRANDGGTAGWPGGMATEAYCICIA